MRTRTITLAAVLAMATLVGACGDDSPAVSDSKATPSSTGRAQAAASCGTIRTDLDRLIEMMGVPGSLDEAHQMVTGELSQIRRTLEDIKAAGDNDAGKLEPVRASLDAAANDAQAALDAVGSANFGTAKDKVQAARDKLGEAKNQLAEACGS